MRLQLRDPGIALGQLRVCAIILGSAGTIFASEVLHLNDAVPGIVILVAVACGLALILPAAVRVALQMALGAIAGIALMALFLGIVRLVGLP